MRDFWRGEASVGEFASRLTGSSDLYEDDGRHPFASINFITAHDGFTMRDFWRGQASVADFASRFTGSSDLYESDGRYPFASINFITAHDGFTLRDLVSYNVKHNEANLEDNRDGTDDNRSWNCGAEGPTNDPDVLALRARQKRAFLATLLLSLIHI